MRKLVVLIVLAFILSPMLALAGIYGTISGKVVDEAGKGVRQASIFVEGTKRGTRVLKKSGKFTLAGVRAGTYTVKISFVGKATKRIKLSVSADQTTDIGTITLGRKIAVAGTVEVVAKKMFNVEQSADEVKISTKDTEKIAAESLGAILSMQAGVQSSDNSFSIRGGRSSNTEVQIDGVPQTDEFTGEGGAGEYSPTMSNFATEETTVKKGGQGAEYGGAASVVSTVARTGRTDKYEGLFRYRTDLGSLNGSSPSGIRIERLNDNVEFFEEGEGHKLAASDEHKIDYNIGGAIPFLDDLGSPTFFLSGKYIYAGNGNRNYEVIDPLGNNLGKIDNNNVWVKNISARVSLSPMDDLKVTLGGQFGLMNAMSMGVGSLYMTQPGYDVNGLSNNIPENIALQRGRNQFNNEAFVKVEHFLESTLFWNAQLSWSFKNDETSRKANTNYPTFFGGFDLLYPEDNLSQGQRGTMIAGQDNIIDQYTSMGAYQGRTQDKYLSMDLPYRNPLTGYYEGAVSNQGTNNAWGVRNRFSQHGNSGGFTLREMTQINFKGNITKIHEDGEFKHEMKAGIDAKYYTLHLHENRAPWASNPAYDIYTDKWGGNIYADNAKIEEVTSKPFNPLRLGIFISDRIKYAKKLVISPSIRMDVFDPNAKTRSTNATKFLSIKKYDDFQDSKTKVFFSPRLSILYPVNKISNLSISYGIYYKMPVLKTMYDAFNSDLISGGRIIGDPDIEPQRQNQYNFTYSRKLGESLSLKTAVYYTDIYNELGTIYIPVVPVPYSQYAVTEYGNSRGVEISLNSQFNSGFDFSVNYTLGWANGTAISSRSNAGLKLDPFTDKPMFPLALFPMGGRDIRHTLAATVNYNWGNDEGPAIAGFHPLENTNINLKFDFRSGSPYTKQDLNGFDVGEKFAERQPSYWNLNLRYTRDVSMKDLFGDQAGESKIQFFIDVNNLLNRTVARAVYASNGSSIHNPSTTNRRIGDFSAVAWYKEASYDNAFSFARDQYNRFGERMYNANADTDKNGIVTQGEKYDAHFKLQRDLAQFRPLYMQPRTIYVGAKISF